MGCVSTVEGNGNIVTFAGITQQHYYQILRGPHMSDSRFTALHQINIRVISLNTTHVNSLMKLKAKSEDHLRTTLMSVQGRTFQDNLLNSQ